MRHSFLPCVLTLCTSHAAAQQPAVAAADPIPARLAAIDPARLKADVETLVGFHSRHTLSAQDDAERGVGAARRWIRARFEELAAESGGRLRVASQEGTRSIRRRGQGVIEARVGNVYALLLGREQNPLGRTYVVSGHYDSRANGRLDAESFAPGADDDASGTAVVLELARVLSKLEPEANIIFLCVSGEELGLFGAEVFAEWTQEVGLDVEGFMTNDIVGGIEGGNGIVDDRTIRLFSASEGLHGPSRELARAIQLSAARYVPEANVKLIFRLDRFGRGGDHRPFHNLGHAAVRFTEANENYARQHQDVRVEDGVQYGDLPEFVSGDYMALVARVNGAALAEMALAPPPPTDLRLRAAVSYDTRLQWEAGEGTRGGYEVVWRETSAPLWTDSLRIDDVTRYTVEKVTADNCFFGLRAVSVGGHRGRIVIPRIP